jgi:hypothetical protein
VDELLGRPTSPEAEGPHCVISFRPNEIDERVETPIRHSEFRPS